MTVVSIKGLAKVVTAARAQVQVEPESRSAAAFVAVSQVGAEMVTAVIHGCTGLLRYSHHRKDDHLSRFTKKWLTANS